MSATTVWFASSRGSISCSASFRLKRRVSVLGIVGSAVCRRAPRMRFVLAVLAPCIKRVIHNHAVLQHFVVIGEITGEAQRNCEQSGRLSGELQMRGIGTAHDQGKTLE